MGFEFIIFPSSSLCLYLSLLHEADAVVGNSSSGLSEAPSVGTATVNVGARQGGRLHGPSVIDCEPNRVSIGAAIDRVLADEDFEFENPYDLGEAAAKITQVLEDIESFQPLLHKKFHRLGAA